jgi:DNA-directed RNA polymerase specialized sigma24 family protein
VAAAVNRLKPKDREIVMLYTWEDLPREVIAGMMGMTKPAIDQRIHRSYQRLARILEPSIETNAIKSPPIAEKGGT